MYIITSIDNINEVPFEALETQGIFLYHVGKNLWGNSRKKTLIIDTEEEAIKIQKRVGGFVKKIIIEKNHYLPFKVVEWSRMDY